MLSKKIPILYLLLAAILSSLITFVAISYSTKSGASSSAEQLPESNQYKIIRDPRDYKFISPIVSVEPVNESEKFEPLRQEIEQYIDKAKSDGSVSSVSVYVRNFSMGDWMSINKNEKYNPGSLLKVGVLITYLRMAENDPKLLDMEVSYSEQKGFQFPIEHFCSDSVVSGKKYKINDLLKYMIKYSDNHATVFLEDHMDTTTFKKEFADLGLTTPRFDDPSYALNVKEYSGLFKALYNAGYLRRHASEKALELLSESTFKQGLVKELPNDVVVSHKYGEFGDDNMHELHESGIVYMHNRPYMITIMTKGKDWNKLSATIGHISKITYDKMAVLPQ